jgi:adenylate cyclase
MRATGNEGDDPWAPIGAAVHTGVPYVGRVGEGDACDFTAVGDPVNTTARLASSAAAGEILVSAAAANASKLDTSTLEMRTLSLRGREESAEVWVARA